MGIISTALKHLIAAGVTGDALVTAIEEIENSYIPEKSIGAKRQQRFRERNALRYSVTSNAPEASQSVTNVTCNASPSSSPPSLLSPTPPYNSPPPSPTPSSAAMLGETFFQKCREYILEKFPLPSLGSSDSSPIHLWQAHGYDFESHIKPVIDSKAARGAKPGSFSYFTPAIENAAQQKIATAPQKEKQKPLTAEETENQMKWYRKMGYQHSVFNPDGIQVSA